MSIVVKSLEQRHNAICPKRKLRGKYHVVVAGWTIEDDWKHYITVPCDPELLAIWEERKIARIQLNHGVLGFIDARTKLPIRLDEICKGCLKHFE